jgi:hypothetical protein
LDQAPNVIKTKSDTEINNTVFNDHISGTWIPNSKSDIQLIKLSIASGAYSEISGNILYSNGVTYPITGYSDIFAESNNLHLQGVSITSYLEENGNRKCISLSGYLNLSTGELFFQQMIANSTSNASNYQQIFLVNLSLFSD